MGCQHRCAILFFVAATALGCGALGDSNGRSSADPEPTPETTAGKLALPVAPAKALEKITNSLKAAGEVKGSTNVSLNPGTLAIPTGSLGLILDAADDVCKASGTPKAQSSSDRAGEYAGTYAYCSLAKSPDGPDTVKGAIDRVKGILCALGDLTYDGATRTVNLKFDTNCFSQTFVDMAKSQGIQSADAQVIANATVDAAFGSTKYDKSIDVDVTSVGFHYQILYKQDKAVLAAAIKDQATTSGDYGDFFAVYIDRGSAGDGKGTIRVESSFTPKNKSNFPITRRLRAFITGNYDVTADALTSVGNLEFITWDYSSSTSATAYSVKGNPTDGYRAAMLSSSADPITKSSGYAIVNSTSKVCYGAGSCVGNDGIMIDSDAKLFFVTSSVPGHPNIVSAETKFKTWGPLDFSSVDLTK